MNNQTQKPASGNEHHCGTNQDGTANGGTLTGASGGKVARKRPILAGMGASAENPQGGHMGTPPGDPPAPAEIVTENFEGEIIPFTKAAAFVNASAMCAAFGKEPFEFLRLPATKAFQDALAEDTGEKPEALVITRRGGDQKSNRGKHGLKPESNRDFPGLLPGTWLHPDLALECARWLSPRFAIWTNRIIRRILAGEAMPAAPALSLNCDLESLIVAHYKGAAVAIQAGNGFVNLSRVLVVREVPHYRRTKRAADFIASLARETGIPEGELISVKRGPLTGGTWLHPLLAVDCARWFSADFSFWLEKVIRRVSAGGSGATVAIEGGARK